MKCMKIDFTAADGDADYAKANVATAFNNAMWAVFGDEGVSPTIVGIGEGVHYRLYWDPRGGWKNFHYWVFEPKHEAAELWMLANAPAQAEWLDAVPQELLDVIYGKPGASQVPIGGASGGDPVRYFFKPQPTQREPGRP